MSLDVKVLERSITAGLGFILNCQSADGSWFDWSLPPGSSSVWTTAYVGYKLRNLPKHLKAKAACRISRASRWLLERQFSDDGWGYNEEVGSDADSTSFAILLLRARGVPVPETAYEHLVRYQQPDGGFATYLPEIQPNSWTISHPDVTPLALLALLDRFEWYEESIRRGIAQVRRQQTRDGIWNSFWWDSFLYGTDASLSLLRTAGTPIALPAKLSNFKPTNIFETALLVSSWLNAEPAATIASIDRWIGQFHLEQQADGSWQSVPILRVTQRDCFEPWAAVDPGPLFADQRRLFTSATILDVLSRAYKHCHMRT